MCQGCPRILARNSQVFHHIQSILAMWNNLHFGTGNGFYSGLMQDALYFTQALTERYYEELIDSLPL